MAFGGDSSPGCNQADRESKRDAATFVKLRRSDFEMTMDVPQPLQLDGELDRQ
jgi:hypothetical protein